MRSDSTQEFTPTLRTITLDYPIVQPSKPTISSITHPAASWSSANVAQISWSMPAGNQAPESGYTYWLKGPGGTTSGFGFIPLAQTGTAHPLSLTLTGQGSYALSLSVTGEPFSGSQSVMSDPYVFYYDAAPPGETTVRSATHPQLLFANNNNPVFELSAIDALSGVSGFATVLDKAPISDPGSAANAGTQVRYERVDNGTWYFHARAVDMAGNTGPVTHYGIRVDFRGALVSEEFVKALPNPVRTDTADLQYELTALATEVVLEFLNTQGGLLKSMDGPKAIGKNKVSWDVGGLANGVYYFRVRAKSSEDGKVYVVNRKVAVLR